MRVRVDLASLQGWSLSARPAVQSQLGHSLVPLCGVPSSVPHRCPHPPELVISVVHLAGLQLGQEQVDHADKDGEVDLGGGTGLGALRWSPLGPSRWAHSHGALGWQVPSQRRQPRAASWGAPGPAPPRRSYLSQGSRKPRKSPASWPSCGAAVPHFLTRMARKTGARRIHQTPMLVLLVQHLRGGHSRPGCTQPHPSLSAPRVGLLGSSVHLRTREGKASDPLPRHQVRTRTLSPGSPRQMPGCTARPAASTHWMFSNRHLTTAQGMMNSRGAPVGTAAVALQC